MANYECYRNKKVTYNFILKLPTKFEDGSNREHSTTSEFTNNPSFSFPVHTHIPMNKVAGFKSHTFYFTLLTFPPKFVNVDLLTGLFHQTSNNLRMV